MSYHEWLAARQLRELDAPFYALLMAAMLQADTFNATTLAAAFPDVHKEVCQRYYAGGGVLPGEPGYDAVQAARNGLGADDRG